MNYPVSRRPSIVKRYQTPDEVEVIFTSDDDKSEILKKLKQCRKGDEDAENKL